jgi:hypothetical protein
VSSIECDAVHTSRGSGNSIIVDPIDQFLDPSAATGDSVG